MPKLVSIPVLTTLVASSVIITVLFVVIITPHIPRPFCSPNTSASPATGWEHTAVSVASQGKIWRPQHQRSFAGVRRRNRLTLGKKTSTRTRCDRWAVVATIFAHTRLLHQLHTLPNWCLVVVGDHKTNHIVWKNFSADRNTTVYLSPADQEKLGYAALQHLPYNHFGRKNIGYLFAIQHGAKFIWDTDDDNELRDKVALSALADFAQGSGSVSFAGGIAHLWNPYPRFEPIRARTAREEDFVWPRGFPLEYVKDKRMSAAEEEGRIHASKVGVFQSLANNDPDIDAIYRLTKEIPLSFRSRKDKIAARPGRLAPFNAQATLWTRQAFWGMLLPVTVHGRVTDIWRSYIVQRLMAEMGQHLAFTSPIVTQLRNVHSLVADMQAEVPLYTQADELTRWLWNWRPSEEARSAVDRVEELFIDLYEIGVLEENDVKLCQAWLDDLHSIDYGNPEQDHRSENYERLLSTTFPTRKQPEISVSPNVAVCVSGQLRSLNLRLDDESHPRKWYKMSSNLPSPNMTVAESIQRNMYPKLGKPDVFMVVSTHETENEPKVGDTSVCESLRPPGGNLFCSVRNETDVAIHNRKMWGKLGLVQNAKKGDLAIQGLLQQLKGMHECHESIRNHSLRTGIVYDWIVRLRPDDYIYAFPSLEQLSIDSLKPTIWFGNFADCCCGNEDRFAIGATRWMREYFERFLYLQQLPWYCSRGQCEVWNAEKFLRATVESWGIRLAEHTGISVCPLKPTYRKSISQP